MTNMHTESEARLQELADGMRSLLGQDLLETEIALGELCITVKRESITKVLRQLRDDPRTMLQQLMDICGADYPERPERFDVVYNLLSLRQNHRVRIKVTADEQTSVPSVAELYSAAAWFERETWDMYGVTFSGNPDLRRILTDYGFEGHPLRKDFPLTGYVEVRYDDEQKRVVYEPVKLVQDFRNFDFLSPWEGMTDIMLPGDEKAVNPKAKPAEKS
ncbi:MAG: NADH-quinone oxidoreductase subunit C [Alphaproteobacteria bacterium]|nr:NADH-quinone oxidoreductase subunit C [Alphaproteobacteria bacterium]